MPLNLGRPAPDDDDAEPPWANLDAPGICERGHAERQPKCPACHDMRIAVWENSKRSSVDRMGIPLEGDTPITTKSPREKPQ